MEDVDFEPDYDDGEEWGVEDVKTWHTDVAEKEVLMDPKTLQVYELEEGEIPPGYLVSLSTLITQQIREGHQRLKCLLSMRHRPRLTE